MTEADSVAELVLQADKNVPASHIVLSDGREFLVTRDDFKVGEVTLPHATTVHKPKIVAGVVSVQDSSSFIEYVNRFKNDDSVIFADQQSNIVLGILDYHKKPENNAAAPGAELAAHRVRFDMPFSIEWLTWGRLSGKLVSHKEFATFLEENSIDVLPLAKRQGLATSEDDADMPETLLELTRSLQVASKVSFNSTVRHGDYEKIDFSKESDATVKGAIGLPLAFQICIPIYFGEPAVVLTCFTRKKIDDGALALGFVISRAENERQAEFQRIVGVIHSSTDLTTLFGKPSA
jgi:hypothetical protein